VSQTHTGAVLGAYGRMEQSFRDSRAAGRKLLVP